MKGLAIKAGVLVLGLLLFAAMPRPASADTYTLDGNSLDAFTLGPGNQFSAELPLSGYSIGLALDQALNVTFPDLTVVDLTTGNTMDFFSAKITSDTLGLFGWNLDYTVTFAYRSMSVTSTPEPSALLLLVLGMAALPFSRRRLGSTNPA